MLNPNSRDTMSRATKAHRAAVLFVVNRKLTGQKRKDAVNFVKHQWRSARDLDNFLDRLSNVEDAERECHPHARLTDKAIVEMRKERADGATVKALAAKYGIHEAYASSILLGRRRASAS